MSKSKFARFTCDVQGCDAREEVREEGGDFKVPLTWGYITIRQLRGRSNVIMWLCKEHFQIIDDWNYNPARLVP